MNDTRKTLEAKVDIINRVLDNIDHTKNMSDTEVRTYKNNPISEHAARSETTQNQITKRSITESDYWSEVFAGSNLPDQIANAGYDTKTLALFSKEADKKGIPTIEQATSFWEKNLTFNYALKPFSESNFQKSNSLFKIWLTCEYTAQSIRQGAHPKSIKKESQRLLMETATARAHDYSPKEGLSLAVLAANTDHFFELAKEAVLSTHHPVRHQSGFGHLYTKKE